MSNKSIHYETGGVQLVNPNVYKTAQTSTAFNRKTSGGAGAPYEALELILSTGPWTDGTHSWVIKEADDNGSGAAGTYTTVDSSNLQPSGGFTQVSSTVGQSSLQRVAYVGNKQYVQVVSAENGTTGLIWGLIAIPGHGRNKPSVASGS